MENLVKTINKNQKLIKKLRKSDKELRKFFLESLLKYYKNWHAKIGDKCILLNLDSCPPNAQILIVEYADSTYVRASKSPESRASHSIAFDEKLTEINEATMLVPYDFFNDLTKNIDIEFYD